MLAETLHDLDYKPTKADPGIWIRPAVKPDGFEYYEYVLTLKKKHLSISYHRNREAVACRTCRIAKEGTLTNLSDLYTKMLPQPRREELLDKFTY